MTGNTRRLEGRRANFGCVRPLLEEGVSLDLPSGNFAIDGGSIPEDQCHTARKGTVRARSGPSRTPNKRMSICSPIYTIYKD
jgi:hypothetical protein